MHPSFVNIKVWVIHPISGIKAQNNQASTLLVGWIRRGIVYSESGKSVCHTYASIYCHSTYQPFTPSSSQCWKPTCDGDAHENYFWSTKWNIPNTFKCSIDYFENVLLTWISDSSDCLFQYITGHRENTYDLFPYSQLTGFEEPTICIWHEATVW